MILVKGSKTKVIVVDATKRIVMIGDEEYDLSNIAILSDQVQGEVVTMLTMVNNVMRAGATIDTRSVYEKAHSTNSNRYTVTIPAFEGQGYDDKVRKVSDKMEEVCRAELQRFSSEHGLKQDRDQLIRMEAYRRAKRDATANRELTEQERDKRIGDLMAKKKSAGRFDLQVRMSVKDPRLDKPNSTAWRDTEVGRVGVYNQYGLGSVPLLGKDQVNDAMKKSEEIAKVIVPSIAGITDIPKLWDNLANSVDKLHVWNGYDPEAGAVYTDKEEDMIEKLKMEMISKLIG